MRPAAAGPLSAAVDPLSAAVVDARLRSIVAEMGSTLTRTTSSPLFQARDCGVGIADADGQVLCQAEFMPLMCFAWVEQLRHIRSFFGDDVHPGDMFTSSDPYFGGNQAQDVAVFAPVFVEGSLAFWTVAKGHVIDLGGPILSGYNPEATEVWQETFRVTPLRLVDRGRLRRDVWQLLVENTRLPEITGRDWQAMMGACRIGERRLVELDQEWGDELPSVLVHLLDAAERRMRAELRQLADGVYEGSAAWCWRTPEDEQTFVARARVTLEDGSMVVDFAGTDDQADHYINGAWSTTAAAVYATLFMLVAPDTPHNSGALRCVDLRVPEGSYLNARFPAPTVLGNFVCNDVVPEAIMRALDGVAPRVTAGWCRPFSHLVVGTDPRNGRPCIVEPLMQNKGGAGASAVADGFPTIGILTGGGAYVFEDYEAYEVQHPLRLVRHEYETDSAGAGARRGGLGLRFEYVSHMEDARLITFGEPATVPYGLAGGRPAPTSSIEVEVEVEADGLRRAVPYNASQPIGPGTRIRLVATGGGGHGDPADRPPALVAADVAAGVVSRAAAAADYGFEAGA